MSSRQPLSQRPADLPDPPDEETQRRWLQAVKEGDSAARERLIRRNLKLVWHVVGRLQRGDVSREDLFQWGVIGLIKAIDGFDLSYDVALSTYAVPKIMGEIKTQLRRDSPLTVSRRDRRLARQVRHFESDYVKQHGETPGIQTISQQLGVPVERIVTALESQSRPRSLSEPLNGQEGGAGSVQRLGDVLGAEDSGFDHSELRMALAGLPSRERTILVRRFFLDQTQSTVAGALGLSQPHVSRLEKKALQRLKARLLTSD